MLIFHGMCSKTFANSSFVNAFKVLVLTFPYEPKAANMVITVSSFGASAITTLSYSPGEDYILIKGQILYLLH